MGSTVFVKVVGFRDVERHALNTLFRVAAEQSTCYALWTPESPVMPHIALVDAESYEAGMALASPGLNPNLKLICVGTGAPERAWRVFPRPINWSAILHSLDLLFAQSGVDISIDADDEAATVIPPGTVESVVVTTSNRSWAMHERAEQAGCRALLDKPFDPSLVYRVFQMV